SVDRLPDNLAAIVDAKGPADGVVPKCLEVLNGSSRRLHEGVEIRRAARIAWEVREADDDTQVVNGCGRIPSHPAEVADIGRDAVLPEHGVSGAKSTYCSITNPGDAYDLALVIDRRGRRAGIAGQGRQLLYLTVLPSPHHRSELENLPWRNAGWVMHRILCPA